MDGRESEEQTNFENVDAPAAFKPNIFGFPMSRNVRREKVMDKQTKTKKNIK